ncbi:unnamed protein product [Calypogeia fissa]
MDADSKTAAPTAGNVLANEMVAGTLAATLADTILFPMMTIKSSLQVQCGGGGYSYNGPVDAISSIAAKGRMANSLQRLSDSLTNHTGSSPLFGHLSNFQESLAWCTAAGLTNQRM